MNEGCEGVRDAERKKSQQGVGEVMRLMSI